MPPKPSRAPPIRLFYGYTRPSHLPGTPRTPQPIHHHRLISTYGYTQAKSLIYSSHGAPADVLSIHTHSLPPPHSALLTLRTLASPLNPADINQITGTYPALPSFTTRLGTPRPAAVPGSEACFEVLATGSAAKTVKKGDWVIPRRGGMGCWSTHVQCGEEEVMRVGRGGEGVSRGQVAGVGVNPVTAWWLLRGFVRLQEGEWWVLNGANSGVGRMALQLGKLWGWKSLAVVRKRESAEEEERLRKELEGLGAERVVTEEEVGERGFGDRVKEWTGGGREKVRLALNCVGGEAAMNLAKCLDPGGVMVTYGGMSRSPMRVGAGMLIFRDLSFRGFWVSRWAEENPLEKEKTVERILEMYRRADLRDSPVVEVKWDWGTAREELVGAVEGTLEGYRKGKGLFVFGDS
ncbi:mitochondrial 2-enoyl thioester reductase [Puttea exsequens]|nr:mitochondrial 2-enoyl thioester reductase [Puttea exsequens]